MTPQKGLDAWLAIVAVAIGVIMCCWAVVVIRRADRLIAGTTSGPTIKQPPIPSAPLMAWSGKTELGFTRAELWSGNDENYPQELVVFASGLDLPTRMRMTITKIPEKISTSNGLTTLFVAPPADRISREQGILAAVTKDGSLQLFAVGHNSLWQACDLSRVGR